MVYYVNTPYNQPVYSTPVYMAGPAGCARAPLMPTQFGQTGAVDPPVFNPPAPNPPNGNGGSSGTAAASSDMWKTILMSPWTWILLALFVIMLFMLMKSSSSRNYYG